METGPMIGIGVLVTPPTNQGRLYPRYNEDARVLAVESKFKRPWPFGVDIDGRLVFDLDENLLLANFDLHIPKHRWDKYLSDDVETIARPGNLVFTQEAIDTKSFNFPLRVRIDARSSFVRIEFGAVDPDRTVALSKSCIALISINQLVGFKIDLT